MFTLCYNVGIGYKTCLKYIHIVVQEMLYMKVAVIGSRGVVVNNLENYLPNDTTEIISGGAKGVDSCAAQYAHKYDIKLTVFLPQYDKYGKSAPLKRNLQIIQAADLVLAFWDGQSHGTKYVIEMCKKQNKKYRLFYVYEDF